MVKASPGKNERFPPYLPRRVIEDAQGLKKRDLLKRNRTPKLRKKGLWEIGGRRKN
jgi:hypothetical protein